MLKKFLELSPYIEVITRRLYWRSALLVDIFTRYKKMHPRSAEINISTSSFNNIELFILKHVDLVNRIAIVHSSFEALQGCGLSGNQIIDRLLALVGDNGTLAMPAFPVYKEEPVGIKRMYQDVSMITLRYDLQRSIPWTGALPFRLMRRKGAIRSPHPLNSMVAIGPLALKMMDGNLKENGDLPCGKNSAWKFCADNDAAIIALGIDLAHSLTMIHVAEDVYEKEWPIKGWYRDRKAVVINNGVERKIIVRERHPKWAQYFAERTLSKDLKENGLLTSAIIDGVLVEIISSKKLLSFLNARISNAYPYFLIPKDSWKITS